jgi:MFS family permease
MTTLGAGLLLLLDIHSTPEIWVTVFMIFGMGNGTLLSGMSFNIRAIANPGDARQAAGMFTMFGSLGMAVGVAIGGNVFQNLMAHHLREVALPEAIARDAEAYIQILRGMSGIEPDRRDILEAYLDGFHGVFLVLLISSAIGLVVAPFLKGYGMDHASGVGGERD